MQPTASRLSPEEASSDEDIVRAVLRGDREQFGALVTRHNQRLYRVGWSYLRDHAQIEDAMQNAYLKAFLSLDKFGRRSGFGTWLTRIMINECLMALRQKRSRREDGAEPAELERIEPANTTGPDSPLHLDDMKAILEQAIARLPSAYRAVFVLREVQRLSTAETAACLGISYVSAKVKLHRARALIKEHLMQNAATAELFAYNAPYCNAMTRRVMLAVRTADAPWASRRE